jgi:heme exporter protein B
MMRLALAMALKDVRLTLFRSAGLVQALLLGLLLVFMFSLSQKAGERVSAQTAATIFWLASSFCQVLVFNAVYAYEETAGQRLGLLLAPAPAAAVWLGKAMAGFVLVFLSQLVFLPATAVFLAQEPSRCLAEGLAMLVLADAGLAALGSLLGALAQGQAARESLLSLLVFPLLVPLLLAAISVFAAVFGDAAPDGVGSWLGFAGAFDAIFLGAGLLLFRFIYTGEE